MTCVPQNLNTTTSINMQRYPMSWSTSVVITVVYHYLPVHAKNGIALHVLPCIHKSTVQIIQTGMIKSYTIFANVIPEENLAKSKSSMLPESKMDYDYTVHYREH